MAAACRFCKFCRFVDDILVYWIGTDRQLKLFLNFLNKINPKIQFTLEIEEQNKINFLDISIKRNINNFSFSVYRKNTCTDTIMPNSSEHPKNIKLSSIYSFVHRLLNIPMSHEDYMTELNTILKIANNNGYNSSVVYRVLHNKQHRQLIKQFYCGESIPLVKQYRKVPFIGPTSIKISNQFKKNDILAAYYNKNNLKNMLVNNKIDKKHIMSCSGVYEIKCNNCNYIYIGKTERNFTIRFKEHMTAYNKGKTYSNVAAHMLNFGHSFNIDNVKILHVQPRGSKLDLLEAFEIQKAVSENKKLMNEQLDLSSSPLLGTL